MKQIVDWLKQLAMHEYTQRFAENDIDFDILNDPDQSRSRKDWRYVGRASPKAIVRDCQSPVLDGGIAGASNDSEASFEARRTGSF